MKIETTIEKKIFDVHGNEIKENDVVLIFTGKKDLVGMYEGITNHGALAFHSLVDDVVYNVMPKSIQCIFPAKVEFKGKEAKNGPE